MKKAIDIGGSRIILNHIIVYSGIHRILPSSPPCIEFKLSSGMTRQFEFETDQEAQNILDELDIIFGIKN